MEVQPAKGSTAVAVSVKPKGWRLVDSSGPSSSSIGLVIHINKFTTFKSQFKKNYLKNG